MLLLTTQSVDRDWLWFFLDRQEHGTPEAKPGRTASSQGLCGCPTCGMINRLPADGGKARCGRCDERLHPWHGVNNQATLALLAAAVIMYLPANPLPHHDHHLTGQQLSFNHSGWRAAVRAAR
ncbi:hypothetical protein MBH78_23285 [Oceanimonas sp. NS1]|nr:hypothetical protein [Oceanimonas sp. NS1]